MTKSKKLPHIPFYPGDWKKDIGIQACNFFDRHVWFEMLLLMWESEERGLLILNGKPMSRETVARLVGLDNQTFNQSLENLIANGVPGIREDGAIYSRRMLREHELSVIRSISGSQGGNPALLNQTPNQKEKLAYPNVQANADTDNDNDNEDLKENGAPGRPAQPTNSKWFAIAEAALEKPDETDNRFITTGKRAVSKYPDIWLTVVELCQVLEDYEQAGIPIDEKKIYLIGFRKVQARIDEWRIKGKPINRTNFYVWLTGWAKAELLDELAKSSKLAREKLYLDGARR